MTKAQVRFSNELTRRLRSACRVTVLTGAGMSAESGIPTFRDAEGLWSRFDPYAMATLDGFRSNPEGVQRWYAKRIRNIIGTAPNAGHEALVALASWVDEVAVVTQNIDGLHERAGSRRVLELHGNILRHSCVECGYGGGPGLDEAELPLRCVQCGGFVRPDVVWFGELLPADVFAAAEEAVARADIFLSVGTSASVVPAATLIPMARAAGTLTVEINTAVSDATDLFDHVLRGSAAEVLPRLIEASFGATRQPIQKT